MSKFFIFRSWVLNRFSQCRSSKLSAFATNRSGVVSLITALAFTALLGFAALGSEVANWYVTKRSMQGAADSAAYTAAFALAAGQSISSSKSEATSVAGGYGYVNGVKGFTVSVNSPPASGSHTNDNSAVEVVITQPQTLALSGLYLSTPPTVSARAVATLTGGSGCVFALDRGNVDDLSVSGGTTLNLNNCNIYVNAPDGTALTLTGGATINANAAYIAGNYTRSNGASFNTTHGIHTGVAPASDPYADVALPSYAGCDQSNFSISGGQSRTFTPNNSGVMVFCNGMSLSGGSRVTLNPGTYVVDRGSFSVSGGSSISGSGVTLVLTSSTASNYATASISGGATVSLSAPTSGPLSGLAIFQDRNAPSSGSDSFSGGATQNITGAIYLPNQNVSFSGGTGTGASTCTQLLAFTITFSGGATFNNSNCVAAGVRGAGNSPIQLVE
jgi:Flp pilus assembly protein TadG